MKYIASRILTSQPLKQFITRRNFHSNVAILDQSADKKGLFGWKIFGNKDEPAVDTPQPEQTQEVVEAEWTQVEPTKTAINSFYQPKELTTDEKLTIIKDHVAQVLGSQSDNLDTVTLADGKLKFQLLKQITQSLGQEIPNRVLNNIENCQHIVDYLVHQKDDMKPIGSHQVDEFLNTQNLPKNITIN